MTDVHSTPDTAHRALTDVTVLMPAYREADRIDETVTAARGIPGIAHVLVIDDGSDDDTAERARAAGADVLRLPRNGGKGAALRAGLAACPGDPQQVLLLLDADLGSSAAAACALLAPLADDSADLVIARFPRRAGGAGFGLAKGLARWGTLLLARRRLEAPISGQRACRRWVLEAAPLANDYGLEVAMNIAAGDAGARIAEAPVEMTHRATGRDWQGIRHRGRQFRHIAAALAAAAFGRVGGSLPVRIDPLRAAAWLAALAFLTGVGTAQSMPAVMLWLPWLATVPGLLLAAITSGLLGARKRNYAGHVIPALGGLAFLPAALSVAPTFPLPVAFFLGWLLLGLYDDCRGDANRKGFRGHVDALLHGTLTAGGIKLLGGGLLALAGATMLIAMQDRPWWQLLLSAPLIALTANALNLCDLRPGRALKVGWLVLAPMTAFLAMEGSPLLAPALLLLLVTLIYAPLDFSGMMMLGDTGANPLGAAIGLLLAALLPWPGQFVVLLLLIALHLYAEHASLTRLIARVPWLAALDRLGRAE